MTPKPCRCGRCGARYESKAFSDLSAVRTFAGTDLEEQVTAWPTGTVVDVRSCARCRMPIARLSRRAS